MIARQGEARHEVSYEIKYKVMNNKDNENLQIEYGIFYK